MKLFIVLFVIVLALILLTLMFKSIGNSTKTSGRKVVRNFVVRFDAACEKYYITNQLETYDEPVTNWFGRRVMYVDKVKADFVTQKLNA